ncbi:hypothetical protein ACLVWU_17530 [Bdellovibrio sp. HCB290]|uniref:hypothetical protein n=1 Tax=Bdellovibrio sp. HCB290 TaxID=3394356 RepID=UPI0039B5569D
MEVTDPNVWKKCSICKKPILWAARYYVCSVSTCNGDRTGYVFCSVSCFDAHLPGARHRQAGAIEKMAPKSAGDTSSRTLIKPATATSAGPSTHGGSKPIPRDTLIIASRLKEYVTAKADYNTSASVMDVLSDYVRVITDRAIDNARAEGRKTVLDRDFDFLKKG